MDPLRRQSSSTHNASQPPATWNGAHAVQVEQPPGHGRAREAMRTRPGHREKMKRQFQGARLDEVVWSLEQIEWALRAEGVGLLEARLRSFALYVDQLCNLNNCYNRQRRLDHNEEMAGLIVYPDFANQHERRTR